MEVLLCRHPDTGDVVSEEEGGVWDAEAPTTTSAKYPGEASVCAGAAMFTVTAPGALGDDGKRGATLALFDYTGKTVVGPKAYEKAHQAELARVKNLKGCWGGPGCGYEAR